jgi:hypothetical protein
MGPMVSLFVENNFSLSSKIPLLLTSIQIAVWAGFKEPICSNEKL